MTLAWRGSIWRVRSTWSPRRLAVSGHSRSRMRRGTLTPSWGSLATQRATPTPSVGYRRLRPAWRLTGSVRGHGVTSDLLASRSALATMTARQPRCGKRLRNGARRRSQRIYRGSRGRHMRPGEQSWRGWRPRSLADEIAAYPCPVLARRRNLALCHGDRRRPWHDGAAHVLGLCIGGRRPSRDQAPVHKPKPKPGVRHCDANRWQ